MPGDNEMVNLIKGAAQEGQFYKMSTDEIKSIYRYGTALVKNIPYDEDLIKAIDKFEAEIKNRLSINHDSNVTSKETNTAGDSLNWKLIFISVLRYYVAFFCIAFISITIKSFRHGAPPGSSDWLSNLFGIAYLLCLCVILRHVFRVLQERATLHAFTIVFICWILPLPIVFTTKPWYVWFGMLLLYMITIPLGASASRWRNPISNKFPMKTNLIKKNKKEKLTISILMALLLVIAAVICWEVHDSLVVKNVANISPILQREDNQEVPPDHSPFIGTVAISHDRSFMKPNHFDGPTQLDTMDLEQIAACRKIKIKKYAQLNFFKQGYDPLKPPHNQIYGHITPKAGWITTVPYYLSNPYILLSLTHANYVAPFTIFLNDINIVYSNGRILETHTGKDFIIWYAFLNSQKGNLAVIMVNAWDAGFTYVHLVESLSENIIPATAPDNIGRTVYSQSSFYHVGSNSHNKNNISPYDARGCITIKNNSSPTKLVFHLWREKPLSLAQKPDLIYEMIFKPW
ncbi:MAG: hypothetical protein ABSD50_12790 [Smithella sp.]